MSKEMVERLGVLFWGLVLICVLGYFGYMGYMEVMKGINKFNEVLVVGGKGFGKF